MNETHWRQKVLNNLEHMANIDYQRRSWTGVGPEISSIDEVISGVFDDAMLMEYIEKYSGTLDGDAVFVARLLDNKISKLDVDNLRSREPKEILDNPDWLNVTRTANQLHTLLQNNR